MSAASYRICRELQTKSGEKVLIYVDFPRIVDDSGDMICEYGVIVGSREFTGTCHGTDGIQAMYLALRSIHSRIDLINNSRTDENKVYWRGGMHEEDLGLPPYTESWLR